MRRWIGAVTALMVVTVATAEQPSAVSLDSWFTLQSDNSAMPAILAIIFIGFAGLLWLQQANKI